jgi:hypothetical protein
MRILVVYILPRYSKYKNDFVYWDVLDTFRRLFLVSLVAFFARGSLVQLFTSILVSSVALLLHVYALPFRERFLNLLQGCALTLVYLTLLCGLALKTAAVATSVDAIPSATLAVLQFASILLLISPGLVFVVLSIKCLPKRARRTLSATLGVEPMEADDKDLTSDGTTATGLGDVELSSIEPVPTSLDGDIDGIKMGGDNQSLRRNPMFSGPGQW